jgi:gamma-glutamylcyclotransferase (GGCT)/AIG2-like uncharacterized protein YtfP
MKSELRIFAYGTLKRGFPSHDEYCAGVLRICPAWLRGRLFKLSPQTPAMTIPDEDIIKFGTDDIAADIAAQENLESFIKSRGIADTTFSVGLGWRKVRGELLVFDDPETRLPLLDSFEEFHPERPSTYTRVLVSINLGGDLQTSAWTYIAGFDPVRLEEYAEESWAQGHAG